VGVGDLRCWEEGCADEWDYQHLITYKATSETAAAAAVDAALRLSWVTPRGG